MRFFSKSHAARRERSPSTNSPKSVQMLQSQYQFSNVCASVLLNTESSFFVYFFIYSNVSASVVLTLQNVTGCWLLRMSVEDGQILESRENNEEMRDTERERERKREKERASERDRESEGEREASQKSSMAKLHDDFCKFCHSVKQALRRNCKVTFASSAIPLNENFGIPNCTGGFGCAKTYNIGCWLEPPTRW